MDKQIERHLAKRRILLAHDHPADGLLGTDSGIAAFLRWFHEDVMMFDSMEYRRQFWREAFRHGHTIGYIPRTSVEFIDPCRHPYNEWIVHLLFLMIAMGASAVLWWLVHIANAHIRRLRRPTYYAAERERRLALAKERRRIRKRRTTSPCPTPAMLRASFAQARASTANMIRFGSMLEDLECYVDNSVVWSAKKGRIVGRKGGIRRWLHENAPDLSERYKTVMKYKAISKRFRQAVGISDPIPAVAVLSLKQPTSQETKRKKSEREHCTEKSRNMLRASDRGDMECANGHGQKKAWHGRTPEEVAKEMLAACEGTLASLTAQLSLMVSAEFVPYENIDRTKNGLDSKTSQKTVARQIRSSA